MIDKDPTAILDESNYRGQIEILDAKWRAGFPKAEWVSAKEMVD